MRGRLLDDPQAEVASAPGAAINPGGVGVEPQNDLAAPCFDIGREALAEGMRGQVITAVTIGMVTSESTVVTATHAASRLTGRR